MLQHDTYEPHKSQIIYFFGCNALICSDDASLKLLWFCPALRELSLYCLV